MIEFVSSRVCMVVCGVILMAAFAVPMSQMMENDEDALYMELVRSDAEALDSFYESGLDELYLRGSSVLPSAGFHLTVDGNKVVLHGPDGREYVAATSHPGTGIQLTYVDIVTIVRDGENLVML